MPELPPLDADKAAPSDRMVRGATDSNRGHQRVDRENAEANDLVSADGFRAVNLFTERR